MTVTIGGKLYRVDSSVKVTVPKGSPFIKTKLSLGGPSVCGAERPFELAAADGGRVVLRPAALLRCDMAYCVTDPMLRDGPLV